MRQVYSKVIIVVVLLNMVFPGWVFAADDKSVDYSSMPKVLEYPGEYNSYLKEELFHNDSPAIQYKGRIFTEAGKDFTYFLWNTTAQISSNVAATNITIQLKDNIYDNGFFEVYIDNDYFGEVCAQNPGNLFVEITNLPYKKHTVTLKQRGGYIQFAWIGFGDKKGDINPPNTSLSYSPELVNGVGGQDTEVSFFTEDNINGETEPSGIDKTLYSIDGDNWQEYTGPFTLKVGVHHIKYYSVDNNKNSERIKESNLIVKNNAPKIAYK